MRAPQAFGSAALAVYAAVSLTACGATTATRHGAGESPVPVGREAGRVDSGDGRQPTANEALAMNALVLEAQRIRGLQFVRPVNIRVQNSAAIRASLSAEMEEDELLESRDVYIALGLLAPDVDIREVLLRVLGEQVVGYYDTKHARLVVREDVLGSVMHTGRLNPRAIDPSATVLVHELVHALQDQVLGLGVSYEAERTVDEGNAFHALVEGDATLAMMVYGHDTPLERVTSRIDILRMALDSGFSDLGDSPELNRAPPIVRIPLLSAYYDGALFCATLHARRGWATVNRAYRELPASSEQVLHPERFVRGERPVPIVLPALPELATEGFVTVAENTIGELELRVYFDLGVDVDEYRAADGWGGDRLRVVRDGSGTLGAIWATRWDTELDAIEAEAAARAVMDTVPVGERASFAVARVDRNVVILRAIAPELHAGILRALMASTPTTTPSAPVSRLPLPGATAT